jgi:AraC-like DNA-binding protein
MPRSRIGIVSSWRRGRHSFLRNNPRTRPRTFCEVSKTSTNNVIHYCGGGAPTTIISALLSFDAVTLKPLAQLLPSLILIKADQARTLALHNTLQLLASEMAEPDPDQKSWPIVSRRFYSSKHSAPHIASGAESGKQGWLRAIFDPQIGTALTSIHENVSSPWTVESMASAAGMSRSAFALRFKQLLGQTPLEYVTEWRIQKAIELLQKNDKKLVDIAKSVGYESDAAFSKAFKRLLAATAASSPCPSPSTTATRTPFVKN